MLVDFLRSAKTGVDPATKASSEVIYQSLSKNGKRLIDDIFNFKRKDLTV